METNSWAAFFQIMLKMKNYYLLKSLEILTYISRQLSSGNGIFRGIGEIASGFSRGLIKDNVEFYGRDQGKIIRDFQGSWF